MSCVSGLPDFVLKGLVLLRTCEVKLCKRDTYWATDDGVTNAELTVEFREPMTFNIVRLREYTPLGQRIRSFALDQWQDGQWREFAASTSIGICRLVRTPAPITTRKIRLRITHAEACPTLSELGVFLGQP